MLDSGNERDSEDKTNHCEGAPESQTEPLLVGPKSPKWTECCAHARVDNHHRSSSERQDPAKRAAERQQPDECSMEHDCHMGRIEPVVHLAQHGGKFAM